MNVIEDRKSVLIFLYKEGFLHIVLMNVTYSTNWYMKTLLEIVGITSNNITFCITFVYAQEKELNYMWALNCLEVTWDGTICL